MFQLNARANLLRLLLAVGVAVGSILAVASPAQAQQQAMCQGGLDRYQFDPGLDLIPEPVQFSASSTSASTCAVTPVAGATKVATIGGGGDGLLSCLVNANVTGFIVLFWLAPNNDTLASSDADVFSLAINGISNAVVLQANITSGPGTGGVLTVTYTFVDDSLCLELDGLDMIDATVDQLSLVS